MTGDQPGLTAPRLSVCIPAYNRPRFIRTALRSLVDVPTAVRSRTEIVVSDDSTDGDVGETCKEELRSWDGLCTYRRNAPSLGMAENWNRCVDLASGSYVLILHDDDFLLPGGASAVVEALDAAERPPAVLAFGVRIVDAQGSPRPRRARKRRATRRRRFLPPAMAVSSLIGNSSFIRFPGMVVSKAAYEAAPPFDPEIGEVADLLMWVRLAGVHGLQLEPAVTAAYRVHEGALTTGMWRPETLEALRRVFYEGVVRRAVTPGDLSRSRARFLSQFVLAGAWRRLQAGDPAEAAEVLRMFGAPAMTGVGVPPSAQACRRLLEVVARAGSVRADWVARPG